MAVAMTKPIIYDELIKEDRVHGRLYYDREIFQEELDKIWYRVWVYVAHESEISQPGDYVTRHIGLQPVIVSRDEDAKINVFLNRCRHRGNIICQAQQGTAHVFRCPYHGWTFSNNGELRGVPYPLGYGPSFNKKELGLNTVPRVSSYRGFIFASFSSDGISLEEQLGYAKEYIDIFVDNSPESEIDLNAGVHKNMVKGNWKSQLENQMDNYHANFVHQSTMELISARIGVDVGANNKEDSNAFLEDLGGGNLHQDFQQPVNQSFADPTGEQTAYFKSLEGHLGKERAQRIQEHQVHLEVFPNLALVFDQVRWIQPISEEETYVYQAPALLKGVPDAINKQRLRRHEFAFGPGGFISVDDWEIMERQQEAVQARANEWLLLSRGIHREKITDEGFHVSHISDEGLVRGFWRHYKKLMSET